MLDVFFRYLSLFQVLQAKDPGLMLNIYSFINQQGILGKGMIPFFAEFIKYRILL